MDKLFGPGAVYENQNVENCRNQIVFFCLYFSVHCDNIDEARVGNGNKQCAVLKSDVVFDRDRWDDWEIKKSVYWIKGKVNIANKPFTDLSWFMKNIERITTKGLNFLCLFKKFKRLSSQFILVNDL